MSERTTSETPGYTAHEIAEIARDLDDNGDLWGDEDEDEDEPTNPNPWGDPQEATA